MTTAAPADTTLAQALEVQDVVILDGGLATALETLGHDLSDRLWSARLLIDDPAAIRDVHRRYLEAGADCITTSSYQATIEGFVARGLTGTTGVKLLALSVRLAVEARDAFWAAKHNRQGRLRPLVAASVGPYGAYLANGAEYTGQYDLDEQGLFTFHEQRFAVLAGAGCDLMACETVPSRPEGLALARLIDRTPGVAAWLSFSCRDGRHLRDGTPLREMVGAVAGRRGIVAVGVNCTEPQYVTSLLEQAQRVTSLPLVAYPNSGEIYDVRRRAWSGQPSASLADLAPRWRAAGARLIGGCCRTGFEEIRALRRELLRRGVNGRS